MSNKIKCIQQYGAHRGADGSITREGATVELTENQFQSFGKKFLRVEVEEISKPKAKKSKKAKKVEEPEIVESVDDSEAEGDKPKAED